MNLLHLCAIVFYPRGSSSISFTYIWMLWQTNTHFSFWLWYFSSFLFVVCIFLFSVPLNRLKYVIDIVKNVVSSFKDRFVPFRLFFSVFFFHYLVPQMIHSFNLVDFISLTFFYVIFIYFLSHHRSLPAIVLKKKCSFFSKEKNNTINDVK